MFNATNYLTFRNLPDEEKSNKLKILPFKILLYEITIYLLRCFNPDKYNIEFFLHTKK